MFNNGINFPWKVCMIDHAQATEFISKDGEKNGNNIREQRYLNDIYGDL